MSQRSEQRHIGGRWEGAVRAGGVEWGEQQTSSQESQGALKCKGHTRSGAEARNEGSAPGDTEQH